MVAKLEIIATILPKGLECKKWIYIIGVGISGKIIIHKLCAICIKQIGADLLRSQITTAKLLCKQKINARTISGHGAGDLLRLHVQMKKDGKVVQIMRILSMLAVSMME